jgi:hypothetical protein
MPLTKQLQLRQTTELDNIARHCLTGRERRDVTIIEVKE